MVDNKYLHTFEYCGEDADMKYVEYMNEIHDVLIESKKAATETHKDYKNVGMTPSEKKTFYDNAKCHLCSKDYDYDNHKVRHHCHYAGKYIGPICKHCNLKVKSNQFSPVFFHNLNYDKTSSLNIWICLMGLIILVY